MAGIGFIEFAASANARQPFLAARFVQAQFVQGINLADGLYCQRGSRGFLGDGLRWGARNAARLPAGSPLLPAPASLVSQEVSLFTSRRASGGIPGGPRARLRPARPRRALRQQFFQVGRVPGGIVGGGRPMQSRRFVVSLWQRLTTRPGKNNASGESAPGDLLTVAWTDPKCAFGPPASPSHLCVSGSVGHPSGTVILRLPLFVSLSSLQPHLCTFLLPPRHPCLHLSSIVLRHHQCAGHSYPCAYMFALRSSSRPSLARTTFLLKALRRQGPGPHPFRGWDRHGNPRTPPRSHRPEGPARAEICSSVGAGRLTGKPGRLESRVMGGISM